MTIDLDDRIRSVFEAADLLRHLCLSGDMLDPSSLWAVVKPLVHNATDLKGWLEQQEKMDATKASPPSALLRDIDDPLHEAEALADTLGHVAQSDSQVEAEVMGVIASLLSDRLRAIRAIVNGEPAQ